MTQPQTSNPPAAASTQDTARVQAATGGWIDEIRSAPEAAGNPITTPLVGEVIDARHPSLVGRVQVRWEAAGREELQWLPGLMGLSLREGDRVLLLQASNFAEPLVAGVIDGFRDRARPEERAAAALELKPDETVRIASEDGTELVEIAQGETGPVVRLMDGDVDLELPGRLRMSAESIEFQARRGKVSLEASDDVRVRGEVIHLN